MVGYNLSLLVSKSTVTLQAIGLLIGMEDVPLEKQSEYLASLLNPLCQQVTQLFSNPSFIYFKFKLVTI